MKKLLPQLYLHGLLTGDFQESFGWLFGEDVPLSPSTIVRLKQQWEEGCKQWKVCVQKTTTQNYDMPPKKFVQILTFTVAKLFVYYLIKQTED